ncbi:MAG: rRNA maturation RNase YbeY [Ginsengibacter sp.]
MGTITFTHHDVPSPLKDKLFAKTFLATVFTKENIDFKAVSYIFCSDEYLLKLNKEYLNHDTLTDILTFTLSGVSLPIVSEIYISIERVRENAQIHGVDFLNELYRVMIHGILHLCGYNDRTPEEKKVMKNKEDYYLLRSELS